MYKVFVNDKALFLTNEVQKETNFKIFLLESIDIKKLIIKLFQNKIENAFLYHPDEKLMMKTLKAKIPVVKAGGGLVYNEEGCVLFIYRNGKWDLPKGGTEKNETMEETAMREVEEETGVTGLSISKKLQKTYHVFKRNGRYKLKQTYWYEMKSTFKGKPKGQLDEGIEKVEWIHPSDIPQLLENSYENIKLLFMK
ncbi:NUDIX hydrolase [Flavobacterium sp. 9AF]|uniref:NUDIX hydrolase n=1 Tax=Flavobacterium sp. 9AF TaxID=2653142 RepID=UPI0012F021E2|nr:NUDIX domain-containing protein [Flavobacterium sp. 9AF]VXB87995.1 NUDIX hydrolase [Flavobacterium sp. 9AF]